MLSVIMLSVIHADCHNYVDHATCIMLNVTKQSVFMLSVVMLSVVMLSVFMLSLVAPI
jgi:hypothetical protein